MGDFGDAIQGIVIEGQSVPADIGFGPGPAIWVVGGGDNIVCPRQRAVNHNEIPVGIVGVACGFTLRVGFGEHLPARIVGVGVGLACGVGFGERPVLGV